VNNDDIRAAVLATIASIAPETDVRSLRADQPLRRQVDLDSIDWINVVAGLQARLGIDIAEVDHERLTSLDSIVAYVAAKRAAAAAGPAAPRTQAVAPLPTAQHRVNGTAVTVRPMRPDDLPMEADFVRHLSTETRYQRFMATIKELPERKLHYLTEVDQLRHVALVATVERDGSQVEVGVVRYIVDDEGRGCEFAIALDDGWHETGLAGILMHTLIGIARARGLQTMEGFVLATNSPMLKFARQLGFAQKRDPEDRDTVRVVLAL
jgi:acetyltransferase